jgi:hypothetical protein
VSEFDFRGFKSSRINPLLFETRFDIGIDETNAPTHSARLYPHRNLKDACASKLFSRMLIAQPPVDSARVGCKTRLSNVQGIRVSDVVRVMEYDEKHARGFGHVFPLVIPQTM